VRIFLDWVLVCIASGSIFAQDANKLRERVSPSVVVVRALGEDESLMRTGGGVVTAPGVVITSCHVLAKAKKVQAQHDDIIYPATLQYPDVERDLCQLAVAKLPAPAVALGGTATLRLAQRIYVVSVARSGELQVGEDTVSALRQYRGMSLIETSADVSQEGNGALLFDPEGRLVGTATSVVTDAPQVHYAITADALRELPRRAMEALGVQPGIASLPSPPSFSIEWNSRIALLENASGDKTLSQAIAMLLDISSESERDLLLAHEAEAKQKRWHNAYAMGTDSKGNLIWGGAFYMRTADDAAQTALGQCMSAAGDSCQVIMVDGEFREKGFLAMTKTLGQQSVAATRQAFLQSLAKSPIETRVGQTSFTGSGPSAYSMGYASARQ